jgi:hypothetical protein
VKQPHPRASLDDLPLWILFALCALSVGARLVLWW